VSTEQVISLHDRRQIAAFLRRDIWLHLYSLGDLDPFFWPYTQWYGVRRGQRLHAVALVYLGGAQPVLLALDADPEPLRRLLQTIAGWLPRRVYAHLSPGLEQALEPAFTLRSHGAHIKMALTVPAAGNAVDCSAVTRLSPRDLPAILALLAAGYADHAFDPRMLATGHTYGIWRAGQLAAMGSVHVFAPRQGVAALGSIMTHPAHRGQGLATAVTATLCRQLAPHVTHIGLNVLRANQAALRVYTRLGFTSAALYGEFSAEAAPDAAAKNG
jgi:ribosomal protein S18 acetylase RimI-like enzyme